MAPANDTTSMYLPHHLAMIRDLFADYSRRQQAVFAAFWAVVIAVGTYYIGVELLVGIGAILLLDLVTDPIYRLFSLR